MYIDRLVLLLLIAAYILSPVLMQWWLDAGSTWYRPYLIWLLLIILTYWIVRSRDLDEF